EIASGKKSRYSELRHDAATTFREHRLMKVGLAVLVLTAVARLACAQMQGEYLITDYGAKGDNSFDNAPVINSVIAKFGSSGGTILIPAGDFRINSPIVVTNKNNVTIRGVNYGQ